MGLTKRYSNGEITVVWQPDLCTHSTTCFQGLPEVFDPRVRPWVRIGGADTDAIVRQVEACPSGALSWERNAEVAAGDSPVASGAVPPSAASVPIQARPPGCARPARGDIARRQRSRTAEGGGILPLRPLGQQALLRRLPCPRRLRRLAHRANRRRMLQPAGCIRRARPRIVFGGTSAVRAIREELI